MYSKNVRGDNSGRKVGLFNEREFGNRVKDEDLLESDSLDCYRNQEEFTKVILKGDYNKKELYDFCTGHLICILINPH